MVFSAWSLSNTNPPFRRSRVRCVALLTSVLGARRKFASLTCAALALRQALGLPLARKGGNGLGMPSGCPRHPWHGQCYWECSFSNISAAHVQGRNTVGIGMWSVFWLIVIFLRKLHRIADNGMTRTKAGFASMALLSRTLIQMCLLLDFGLATACLPGSPSLWHIRRSGSLISNLWQRTGIFWERPCCPFWTLSLVQDCCPSCSILSHRIAETSYLSHADEVAGLRAGWLKD